MWSRSGIARSPTAATPADSVRGDADGTPLTPSEAFCLGLAGEIRRLVIGADGEVVDFGPRQRLFTGPVREAIKLAHRTCTHPGGCDVPSYLCEIDHILGWHDGGRTDAANGQPHCKGHNLWKERQERKKRRRRE